MELTTLAIIALWIVVIALVVVVFALARQIGVLYERVAPAGALMVNQQIKVGDKAPEIAVRTLRGDDRTAGRPNQLMFFLAPDCPICKSLLPVLKSMHKAEPQVEVLLISDGGTEQEHVDYVEAQGLQQFDYALSEIAGRGYGVGKLPYGVLVNAAGTVASLGIVNSREHLESLFEAERLGVASIQEYLDQRQGDQQPLHYDAAKN